MSREKSYPADFQLLLASRSPRRQQLLEAIGVPFRVVPSGAKEGNGGAHPSALAERNALSKAQAARVPGGTAGRYFVLGTDTIVVSEGRVLGKPGGKDDAKDMLRALSGRTHRVISGVALLYCSQNRQTDFRVAHAVTRVRFAPLGAPELEAYLASDEWRGKAGAYAIQGRAALFVEGIEGDYSNVVGLPLPLLARLFRKLGFDLLRRVWVDAGE